MSHFYTEDPCLSIGLHSAAFIKTSWKPGQLSGQPLVSGFSINEGEQVA